MLNNTTGHPYFYLAKLLSGLAAIGILAGYTIRFVSASEWLEAVVVGLTAMATLGTLVLAIRRDSRLGIAAPTSSALHDDRASVDRQVTSNISGAIPGIIGTFALLLFVSGLVVATATGQWSAVIPWLGPAAMFGVAAMAVRTRQDRWWS